MYAELDAVLAHGALHHRVFFCGQAVLQLCVCPRRRGFERADSEYTDKLQHYTSGHSEYSSPLLKIHTHEHTHTHTHTNTNAHAHIPPHPSGSGKDLGRELTSSAPSKATMAGSGKCQNGVGRGRQRQTDRNRGPSQDRLLPSPLL